LGKGVWIFSLSMLAPARLGMRPVKFHCPRG